MEQLEKMFKECLDEVKKELQQKRNLAQKLIQLENAWNEAHPNDKVQLFLEFKEDAQQDKGEGWEG